MLFTQYDKDFLVELDKVRNKIIYARITALQFNETPIETIEGRVTGGSINIDGASSLRRTCSLTIAAQDFNYNDYYWGLNTKFKLEIGVENSIAYDLPDIIWFNQGIYLITDFSTSHSTSSFNISISGKDKMCLLNGEVGGTLIAETDFGKIEEEDASGNWTIRSLLITDIIRNMVHVYAGEPYHNIVINDLDTYGLELLEYRYDMPMYLYRTAKQNQSKVFENATMDGSKRCWIKREGEDWKETTLKELDYNDLEVLTESFSGSINPSLVSFESSKAEIYYVAKIEYGQVAGYRITDLTYAGDLIGKVGESITSVLDKIRNMLVEYEYFYDVNGQFIFQKKSSYISTPWTPITNTETGNPAVIESYSTASTSTYTFSGGELITSFNNSPDLGNVRNDFSVWGQRTTVSGAEIPVHLRYAIDKKPISYRSISVSEDEIKAYNKKYNTTLSGQESKQYLYGTEYAMSDDEKTIYCDWREIIYQMACDYYKYNHLDDFELKVIAANKMNRLYINGQTGYEAYYIDLQGFWRELFNPELDYQIKKYNHELSILEGTSTALEDAELIKENSIKAISDRIIKNNSDLAYIQNWFRNPQFKEGTTEEEKNAEIQSYYNSILNLNTLIARDKQLLESANERLIVLQDSIKSCEGQKENYYYSEKDGDKLYWNKTVFERPEALNFWFDFMDSEGDISKYSVRAIGCRPKSVNETSLKGIYFRETPSVIFTNDVSLADDSTLGYKYIQVPDIESMFSISSQGKSIKDKLDELLYQHSYCTENASISAVPIYYLEPNTRIHIYDEKVGLNNDYILNKITLPLSHSGTMSITAMKAVDNNLY